MPKEIKLTQGYTAICDDEDYPMLSKFKWHAALNNGRVFAQTVVKENGKRTRKPMHHLVKPEIKKASHINDNLLDNRKENITTHEQYKPKIGAKYKSSGSKYIGVFKGIANHRISKTGKTYNENIIKAVIAINKKKIYIGGFKSELEAAIAYNQWAIANIGSNAPLNVIPDNYLELIEQEKQEQIKPERKVVQLNIADNSLVAIHNSFKEAGKAVNAKNNPSTIFICCDKPNEKKQAYGFKWMRYLQYLNCLEHGFPEPISKKLKTINRKPKIAKVSLRTNKIVETFTSIKDAAANCGTTSVITISNACKQIGGTAYNHAWFYYSDYGKSIQSKLKQ